MCGLFLDGREPSHKKITMLLPDAGELKTKTLLVGVRYIKPFSFSINI